MFVGLKLQVPSANLRSVRAVFTQAFVLLSLCTATSSIAAPTFESLDKAMTADERMYGARRITELLNATPAGTSATETVKALYDDVKSFVEGAPPNDDITIVALKYSPPS